MTVFLIGVIVVALVVAFVAGIFVGRRNKNKVEAAVTAYEAAKRIAGK